MAQRSFDAALRSALERIVTASGHSFGDWQWRLDTLPFALGGLFVYCVAYGPAFNDALCVFNTKMETGLLSNTSEITSPKLMKKLSCSACSKVFTGDIYEDHIVSCAGIIGFKHRDNVMCDALVDICFRSGILAGKEVDIGLGGGCDKPLGPADMLLYSWDEGLDVCVDLTGLALTRTGMVNFMPVRVAIDAALRKTEKDAVTLLKWIRKFFVSQDIGSRAAIHIFNRIGFAIAKGVGPQLRIVIASDVDLVIGNGGLPPYPSHLGGLVSILQLISRPAFEDALCGFNVKIEIDLLSNPSDIAAQKLMKCSPILCLEAVLCLLCVISADKEVDTGLRDGRDKPLRPAHMLPY
ncbi:hypothetical protein Tco_0964914 [Tanacetum coccineum]